MQDWNGLDQDSQAELLSQEIKHHRIELLVNLSQTSPLDPETNGHMKFPEVTYELFPKLLQETYAAAQDDKELLKKRSEEWAVFPQQLSGAPSWILLLPDKKLRITTPIWQELGMRPNTLPYLRNLVDIGLAGRQEAFRVLWKTIHKVEENGGRVQDLGGWIDATLKRSFKWLTQDASRIGDPKGKQPLYWPDDSRLYLTDEQWMEQRGEAAMCHPSRASDGAASDGAASQRASHGATSLPSQSQATQGYPQKSTDVDWMGQWAAAAEEAERQKNSAKSTSEAASSQNTSQGLWVHVRNFHDDRSSGQKMEVWEKKCKGTGKTMEKWCGPSGSCWSSSTQQWDDTSGPSAQQHGSFSGSTSGQADTRGPSAAAPPVVDYSAGLANAQSGGSGDAWGAFKDSKEGKGRWNKKPRPSP